MKPLMIETGLKYQIWVHGPASTTNLISISVRCKEPFNKGANTAAVVLTKEQVIDLVTDLQKRVVL